MSVRINLLPIRAAKRASNAKQELYAVIGIAIVVLAGLYFWRASVLGEIEDTQRELSRVERQLRELERDRARVQDFISKNKTLESKRDAITQLEAQRIGPAQLLNDLATILTAEKKVWLTELVEQDGAMTLKGAAMESVNISDFQLALKRNSRFFKDIQLVVVKQETVKESNVDYLSWEIRCRADYAAGGS